MRAVFIEFFKFVWGSILNKVEICCLVLRGRGALHDAFCNESRDVRSAVSASPVPHLARFECGAVTKKILAMKAELPACSAHIA